MKKILNDPARYVDDMLDGLCAAYPEHYRRAGESGRVLAHAGSAAPGKVGIVTGGGSGHMPLFHGYVGPGLAAACAIGNVFAGPRVDDCLTAMRLCDGGAGILQLYGNYGGDKMNFDMAREFAEMEGVEVKSVRMTDDIASAPPAEQHKRRGVAGLVYAYKLAGAKADTGASLAEVTATAEKAVAACRTIGVALSGCIVPESGNPAFTLSEDDMEFGMGIHGEPGIWRGKLRRAATLADDMLTRLLEELPAGRGDRCSLLVNSLGATPLEELYIVYQTLAQRLSERRIDIVLPLVGRYATSMEMSGFSLTLCALDDELETLLRAPRREPFLESAMTDCAQLLAAIDRILTRLPEVAPELNALDGTLGDGDLGATLAHCAVQMRATLTSEALSEAVNGADPVAQTLRLLALACAKAYGSSFGTLLAQGLLTAANVSRGKAALSQADFAALLHAVVAALSQRGGATLGDKTVLDSLHALAQALERQPAQDNPCALMRATLLATLDQFRQQPNDPYRALPLSLRADFLDRIGENMMGLGEALIARAVQETGLPRGRIEGERARTVGQLAMFADIVRRGAFLQAIVEEAQPQRKPLARPDLCQCQIPLGPVAVFGASNFPLAFSVAGGDSASALAAGCPIVVKAYPSHPGTSELVGRAIQQAAQQLKLPEGVFSLLHGGGHEVGERLVTHPYIQAVGFTGSRAGGLSLLALAQRRAVPVPFYAEMSSINPQILLPAALANRPQPIAAGYVASLTLGAGQFCTSPGLLLALKGQPLTQFCQHLSDKLAEVPAATMLSKGIWQAWRDKAAQLAAVDGVTTLALGRAAQERHQAQASVLLTDGAHFLAEPRLREEVFGPTSLVVACDDDEQLQQAIGSLEGQLTLTLHLDEADTSRARALLPTLERRAGRLLVNGFPTGVDIGYAMVHGGPFPATSDARSTSVGAGAIMRFLRPVCYQDFPDALLPAALGPDATTPVQRY